MRLDYGLFMAEAEGLLDTHESKVQRVLRDLRDRYNDNCGDVYVEPNYLDSFDLEHEDLSEYDLQRIAKVVETGRI